MDIQRVERLYRALLAKTARTWQRVIAEADPLVGREAGSCLDLTYQRQLTPKWRRVSMVVERDGEGLSFVFQTWEDDERPRNNDPRHEPLLRAYRYHDAVCGRLAIARAALEERIYALVLATVHALPERGEGMLVWLERTVRVQINGRDYWHRVSFERLGPVVRLTVQRLAWPETSIIDVVVPEGETRE